jgi:hypothetical protein
MRFSPIAFMGNPVYDIQYLLMGAGGAGGNDAGGGGGAGGFVSGSTSIQMGLAYSINVGTGSAGSNGTDTIAFNLTALGGGKGGSSTQNGFDGGSGGGAYKLKTGGTGSVGQGFNGGDSQASNFPGGGGGASVAGNDGAAGSAPGGDGKAWLNGILYGGGGGAGQSPSGDFPGPGGAGGGGTGARNSTTAATTGTDGLGGGGGGGCSNTTNGFNIGARGGNGVVIVRYPGSPIAIGGVITESGSFTYHTFASSSTLLT